MSDKFHVTIRDVREYDYVVEAGDAEEAARKAEQLWKEEAGGLSGDYYETSARKVSQA